MENTIILVARVLLALIFVQTGFSQLGDWHDAALEYIRTLGIPGVLLPLVIAFQVACGFALIAGALTRWVSLALGLFCVVTAVLFHANFSDPTQGMMFMKNIAMTGGFLLLFVHGAGAYSVDARFGGGS